MTHPIQIKLGLLIPAMILTSEGPSLNKGRKYPLCSQLKDDFGNDIILVVAGHSGDTIEFLNVTLMDKWMYGKYLESNKTSMLRD